VAHGLGTDADAGKPMARGAVEAAGKRFAACTDEEPALAALGRSVTRSIPEDEAAIFGWPVI
jgi:hypothetical protein